MAKKDEYDAPPRFGSNWHTYQPSERAYVKHDDDDPTKVHVYIVGSEAVKIVDEAEFLDKWQPCAEQRPAEHVA